MKRILITGANSYVGTNVERWLMREPEKYHVDTIDMIDGSWREKDFSGYDVVFHVAGIAHVKETRKNRDLFFKVNRDLAIEVQMKKKQLVVDFVRLFFEKQTIKKLLLYVKGLNAGMKWEKKIKSNEIQF